MSYTKIKVECRGVSKVVKEGISWTTLFFGWLPSLIRGDLPSALKLFVLDKFTFGIYSDIKSLTINKDYMDYLKVKGFKSQVKLEGFPSLGFLEEIIVSIVIGTKLLILGYFFIAPITAILKMLLNLVEKIN